MKLWLNIQIFGIWESLKYQLNLSCMADSIIMAADKIWQSDESEIF